MENLFTFGFMKNEEEFQEDKDILKNYQRIIYDYHMARRNFKAVSAKTALEISDPKTRIFDIKNYIENEHEEELKELTRAYIKYDMLKTALRIELREEGDDNGDD